MSNESAREQAPAGRVRRRGRLVAVVVVVVVVVLVAAAAITWAALRTRGGPVEAVRDYVGLIAAGDVAAATRLVDPAGYTGYDGAGSDAGSEAVPPSTVDAGAPITASDDLVLDPSVLTAVAAKASERIVVTDVALDYGDDADVPVDTTVDVEVDYDLAGVSNSATLRAQRVDDTWFGFTRWRVVDPLLVPLVVQSNAPELGPAEVGADGAIAPASDSGASERDPGVRYAVSVPAEVDLSGPDLEGASQRATLLYPGVYTLSGSTSTYLEAPPQTAVVAEGTASSTTSDVFGDVVNANLWFEATPALADRISAEATDFLAGCFAAPAAAPADCPRDLRLRSDSATDVVMTAAPVLKGVTSYQVEHPGGVAAEPALRATFTTGRFDYTSDDGSRDDAIFFLYAWVHADGDDVTLEFRPDL